MSLYDTEKTGCLLAAGLLPPSTIEFHSLFNLLFRLGLPLFGDAAEGHLSEQFPALREIEKFPQIVAKTALRFHAGLSFSYGRFSRRNGRSACRPSIPAGRLPPSR